MQDALRASLRGGSITIHSPMRLTSADKLLSQITAGKTPPIILVGGNNEYLVEQAFTSIRDAIVGANRGMQPESYPEGADLGSVIDNFRTHSLFGGSRLLVLNEVNAFVSKKEVKTLLDKALDDWRTAKTDRKRASSVAKLLHILGLIGADLEESDDAIVSALGVAKERSTLEEMLRMARATGKRASRGEGDAALLTDAVVHGGAPGAVLLMRTGEIPEDSTTVKAIDKSGAIVQCDLSREAFAHALDQAVSEIANDYRVKIDGGAVTALRRRLGIERVLADKFSKEVPDLRTIVSEIERLATLAGESGRVTPQMVEQQVEEVSGGARYEFASLFTEGKYVEAVVKLRELVAQMRREDPRTPIDMHYGKFIFNLADELRQIIAVRAFARTKKLDLRRSMNYNQFKDSLADTLGDYLKELGVVRQKPHPFVLLKKFEAAKRFSDEQLFAALAELAELDFTRKSGGVPAEVGIETLVLAQMRA